MGGPNLLACGSQPISELGFCLEVRGQRRGPRVPRGGRRPGPGPAVPSAPGAPCPAPPRLPAEESAGARQFLPRGGRERLRDPSHLTHTVTHTYTHTHRTGARARFPGRRHRSLGRLGPGRAHTDSRGNGAARGPPLTQKRPQIHAQYSGMGAVTHRGCAPVTPRAPPARGPAQASEVRACTP